MNVLFVSENHHNRLHYRTGSTRYRCYHMAEGLHAAGVLADVATLSSLKLASLSRYDVVSIQQPSASRKLLNVLERCRRLNIRTVADVDALEFDPTLAKYSFKCGQKNSPVASVRLDFMRQNLALQHFDEISVATEALARARRSQAPSQRVYVVPNALSPYWLDSNDHIKPCSSTQQRIGYFPDRHGSSLDFAQAAKAISTYIKGSSKRGLYAAGALEPPDTQIPDAHLVRGAWIDFMKLPKILSSCWANLVPLQHNCIDYAQPHTKFIEAAAFGVPTISSPSDDLLRHDVPGLLIAETFDQWLQSLEALDDDVYHKKCSKALYDYARDCCLANHSAELLIRQWSAKHEQSDNETATSLSAAS